MALALTPPNEKETQARDCAEKLLRDFGLWDQGWRFQISNTKTRVGECIYKSKTILVSMYYLPFTSRREIEDTIRHEIAHALLGPGHGHNKRWKDMAVRVGAKPERLAGVEAVSAAPPNYILRCPDCYREWERFRVSKRRTYSCPHCHTTLDVMPVPLTQGGMND